MSYTSGLMMGAAVGKGIHDMLAGTKPVQANLPARPAFQLVHAVRGRRRYLAATLRGNERLATLLQGNLAKLDFVESITANAVTGSLAICYEGTEAEMDRLENWLAAHTFRSSVPQELGQMQQGRNQLSGMGQSCGQGIGVMDGGHGMESGNAGSLLGTLLNSSMGRGIGLLGAGLFAYGRGRSGNRNNAKDGNGGDGQTAEGNASSGMSSIGMLGLLSVGLNLLASLMQNMGQGMPGQKRGRGSRSMPQPMVLPAPAPSISAGQEMDTPPAVRLSIRRTMEALNHQVRKLTMNWLDLSSVASLLFLVRGFRKIFAYAQWPTGSQMLWWAVSLMRGWKMA